MRRTLVVVMTLAIAGCGDGNMDTTKYVSVTGVVILDGKPTEGATVTFFPKGKGQGQMSIGVSGPDGRYSLKSAAGKPGAAVGDHDVIVTLSLDLSPTPTKPASVDDLAPPSAVESGISDAEAEKSKIKFVIPERYGQKGVLTAKVPEGGLSDHKLDLQSK